MSAPGARVAAADLLFDRLAPAEAATSGGDPTTPVRSIARELERLFNTRAPAAAGTLERRPVTVMDYGIPDLSLFPAADAEARARLARHLTRAIEFWEPRLRSPAVVIEQVPHRADALSAHVSGTLGPGAGAARISFELALTDEPALVHAG